MTIADLVEAGLLAPGDTLTFRRSGEVHRATVTDAGKLRLRDGREFPTPSWAAKAAAGTIAEDGWHAWAVSNGASLAFLRQRLLERAAQSTSGSGDASSSTAWDSQRRYEWLSEAREQADAGRPTEIRVRDLLDRWSDTADSGSSIELRIEADLSNHDLTTTPSFRTVSMSSIVRLVIRARDSRTHRGRAATDETNTELYVGLTVGNIPSALGGVVSVSPNAAFEQAITKMRLNGYSQLAVLNGPRNLRGAVTWESIAYKRHVSPDATLADAIVPARAVHYDQALIEVLPYLVQDADFIFVLDQTNLVKGIVTNADVVDTYREIANPFILIGELDQVLRQIISRTFTLAEIKPLCDRENRAITSPDELEMGDYLSILGNPARWTQLSWNLDRAEFISRLDELRRIRNDVMHFNPRPLPPNTVKHLRSMLDILRDLGGS